MKKEEPSKAYRKRFKDYYDSRVRYWLTEGFNQDEAAFGAALYIHLADQRAMDRVVDSIRRVSRQNKRLRLNVEKLKAELRQVRRKS